MRIVSENFFMLQMTATNFMNFLQPATIFEKFLSADSIWKFFHAAGDCNKFHEFFCSLQQFFLQILSENFFMLQMTATNWIFCSLQQFLSADIIWKFFHAADDCNKFHEFFCSLQQFFKNFYLQILSENFFMLQQKISWIIFFLQHEIIFLKTFIYIKISKKTKIPISIFYLY